MISIIIQTTRMPEHYANLPSVVILSDQWIKRGWAITVCIRIRDSLPCMKSYLELMTSACSCDVTNLLYKLHLGKV